MSAEVDLKDNKEVGLGAEGMDKPIDKEGEGIFSSSWLDGDAEH